MKPMSQVPMTTQFWPNSSRQDFANANIADGNPIFSQCGLTRERQHQYRQWETNIRPILFMLSEKTPHNEVDEVPRNSTNNDEFVFLKS